MKKIVAFTLLLCMVLALSACGDVKITMQEVYDAAQPEAMLKNHKSVYVRSEADGEFFGETYLTKDYVYDYISDEQFSWVELITDDVSYRCDGDDYLYYVYITPDGVTNFASEREKFSASVIVSEDTADEIIESVSKKDGRITMHLIRLTEWSAVRLCRLPVLLLRLLNSSLPLKWQSLLWTPFPKLLRVSP